MLISDLFNVSSAVNTAFSENIKQQHNCSTICSIFYFSMCLARYDHNYYIENTQQILNVHLANEIRDVTVCACVRVYVVLALLLYY